jgi:hypothetical protein
VKLHTPGNVFVSPEGIPLPSSAPGPTAAVPRGALLTWDTGKADLRMEEWALDDPLLAAVWGRKLTRLSFRMSPAQSHGSFTLTARAQPLTESLVQPFPGALGAAG